MSKPFGTIALSYAEKLHFKIFPLKEKSKLPATKHGCIDATDNPETIYDWWQENTNYNIGLSTDRESGVWVLDVDGLLGFEDLKNLEKEHGKLPRTPMQQTANGCHYLFKHPPNISIANRAKIIRHDLPGGGLDVRGNGGYIVLAPSIHPDSGKPYTWIVKPSECPVAQPPQWLIDLVTKSSQAPIGAAAKVFAPPSRILKRTNPQAIIDDQLAMVSSSIEGSRNHTLNIAAMKIGKVIDKAEISESEAVKMLASAAKNAGLEDHEIRQTINSGLNYGKTVPYKYGQHNNPPKYNIGNDVKQDDIKKPLVDNDIETKEHKVNKFKLLSYNELLFSPKVQWCIDGIIPKKSFGVIYGIPGGGKTFVSIDMALCIAHGLEWHRLHIAQGSVLYIAQEGMGGISKRLKAWQAIYAPDDPAPPFYAIAANVNMRDEKDVNELIAAIDAIGGHFSCIFIDTVARSILGADENSSTDMGLFVAACDAVKEHTGSTVIGVHHSGKDVEKGMRGSSALLGAVDTVIQVSQEVEGIIVLKNEKQKDAELFKDMVFNTALIATGINETSLIIEPSSEISNYQKKVKGKTDLFIQALLNCIIVDNQVLNGCPAARFNSWKNKCVDMMICGDTIEAQRKALWRAQKRLQEDGKICVQNGLISYISQE